MCFSIFMVTVTIVSLLIKNLVLTTLFLLIYIGTLILSFPYIAIKELNHQASRERYQESKIIYTIPIYEEPAPSYDTLFAMNTLPPPYEIAIKENRKKREERLTIVCVE